MVAPKVASHPGSELRVSLSLLLLPPSPHGPQLVFVLSSFFSESQITTSLMCSGCLQREVWGTLARRAAPKEGPAARGQTAQFALPPPGVLSRWEQRSPGRSSSPRAEAGV